MTSSPGRLGPGSEGPRGRPAVPGDSVPGPKAREVDQLARATRARVRGHTLSYNCPGRLGLVSEGPRCSPDEPGTPARLRVPRGSTRSPGRLGPVSAGPLGRPLVRATGPVSQVQWDPQIVRVTWARLPVPAVSTRYPWRLGPCSDSMWGRQGVPGDSGSGPRDCDIHQHSRVTRARV